MRFICGPYASFHELGRLRAEIFFERRRYLAEFEQDSSRRGFAASNEVAVEGQYENLALSVAPIFPQTIFRPLDTRSETPVDASASADRHALDSVLPSVLTSLRLEELSVRRFKPGTTGSALDAIHTAMSSLG